MYISLLFFEVFFYCFCIAALLFQNPVGQCTTRQLELRLTLTVVHQLFPELEAAPAAAYPKWNLRKLFDRVILASNPDAHSSRVLVQLALPDVRLLLVIILHVIESLDFTRRYGLHFGACVLLLFLTT